jgi:Putative Ig domain
MFLESSPGFQTSKTAHRRFYQFLAISLLTIATSLATGCAGISSAAPISSTKNPSVQMNLSPASADVASGGQIQFSATLTSTRDTGVMWHASGGTITRTGLFTAPTVSSATKVTVVAMSVADNQLIASSEVTVSPLTKLSIQTAGLPAGTTGASYTANLKVVGGVGPYNWQVSGGALPQGLSLDQSSGTISGTTSHSGDFSFTASVTDANTSRVSGDLTLKISTAISSNFDGPAELPRVYVKTDMADTPAPGKVISVPKGGDFQQALNSANCGDTIQLQAAAVYTGQFQLPAKNCDDNHWIIVRTNASDSSLPPERTRVSPCFAGVRSLPGRPAFNCPSAANVLAKIQFDGTGSGVIVFKNGANHYRLMGLEITRTAGTGVVYNIAVREKGGSANHIIFDRSWIHGTAHDETERGVMMSGTQYIGVIDSYLSDFHCTAITGACIDSQAVAGGLGSVAMGPFKVVNNFLEAAAENIELGGDAATTTPADIEIRHNHMFKPMTWMVGQPGFVGGVDGNPFIVKNIFELKNAQRVLFEGNILENAWGGFSQRGAGIIIGPKNQSIGTANVCPICQVTDITIRYVKISHVGGGMVLGNGVSVNGGVPLDGGRYSIHDVTIDDIDTAKYDGLGVFAQVSTGPGAPVLHDVTISHVTAFQPGVMLNVGDNIARNKPMRNFVYINNLVNAGTLPIHTTGGGRVNCAYEGVPRITLPRCFQPYTFTRNAIIDTPAKSPSSHYPAGNFFPVSTGAIHFLNYANGNGGDYRLLNSSPYKNAGTDGKDLGADVDAIAAATSGVE